MKKSMLIIACLLIVSAGMHAQSAARVSEVLKTEKATVGQAAYLAALYLNLIPETAEESEAYDVLMQKGICRKGSEPSAAVSYKQLAGLCMRTWNTKGGIMYSITKSDHYAFRELQDKGYIPQSADPQAPVSGSVMIALIGRFIETED